MLYTGKKNFWPIFAAVVLLCATAVAQAQWSTPSVSSAELADTLRGMQEQIRQLQGAVTDLRAEAERYRSETQALRHELQQVRGGEAPSANAAAGSQGYGPLSAAAGDAQEQRPPGLSGAPPSVEDELRLLAGKVDEQYQTKVESGSKYRVRLSGLVLLNLFANRGIVDTADLPGLAEAPRPLSGNGEFGGTIRQSQFSVQVFGPTWAGAKVSGNVSFDFAGGFPDTSNGVTLGLVRLRTGTVRLDWPRSAVVAGQDVPFISPLSPTSLATVAEPALSYSGNLWTWTPQFRVEHRLSLSQNNSAVLQAGILDPLTGEPPRATVERLPHAGELSRQPAFAARVGWVGGAGEDAAGIGAGTYYSRQDWGFGRKVDGWAATADWSLPVAPKLSLSGEFYRGRAIGGLGGATGHSILSTDVLINSQAAVQALNVIGGWTQLKYRVSPTLQFNAAFGLDSPFSKDLRAFRAAQNLLDPELGRNQATLINFIYRPRSNLLFSTEYRHLHSVRLNSDRRTAEHVNMSIGVLF